ncbi:PqiC family protein [Frigidibacter sp. MR17.24]|uniref:PqiC family protein n=1 Tax=Frigidibacter sp. MR17.24 TaxID=3127345 RepID=UPI003012C3D2
MPKTTLIPLAAALALASALAACTNPPRYTTEPPPSALRVQTAARTVLVRDVSLPEYASSVEMAVEHDGGAVKNAGSALWADEPVRGFSVALAKALNTIASATVASEPWPLQGLPDAEVSVRVARGLAGADGIYRLEGQYFILSEIGRGGATTFAIAVPTGGNSAERIATAQSAALGQLAEQIARSLGR